MPGDPDSFALSLAHIVLVEDGEDEILGQAWLAAPNTMVTCGHVVEAYKRSPASITVKFPASGNRYVVRSIKTHPSYGQGKDQLVRFDVATLQVDLRPPDSNARALPITYDVQVPAQQNLSAIRYPSHLGQFTTSQFPLAQVGRYLGRLKKDDRFHLLHDLALSPGDSGSPLFDRNSVVAIHCGDTATLPGLNLPTTSIRLALSIDALRALSIPETVPTETQGLFFALGPGLLSFVVSSLVAFLVSGIIMVYPNLESWRVGQSDIQPIEVKFNEPVDGYYLGQEVTITLTPRSDCYLYLFYVEGDRAWIFYPPPATKFDTITRGGSFRVIDGYGVNYIRADDKGELHLLALKFKGSPVKEDEAAKVDTQQCELPLTATELMSRIEELQKNNPHTVLYQVLDAPRGTKPRPADAPDPAKSAESRKEPEPARTEPEPAKTEPEPAKTEPEPLPAPGDGHVGVEDVSGAPQNAETSTGNPGEAPKQNTESPAEQI